MRESRKPIIVAIDGTDENLIVELARAAARQPGVAWTPLSIFDNGNGVEHRQVKKDVIKPFKAEGRVREIVPKLQAETGEAVPMRGRPQTGINVLIFVGLGASDDARKLKVDHVCWLEQHGQPETAQRTAALSKASYLIAC